MTKKNRFEYVVFHYPHHDRIEEKLNKHAKEGYRLVFTTEKHLIMEREINDTRTQVREGEASTD